MLGHGPISSGALAESPAFGAVSGTAFSDATKAGTSGRKKPQAYLVHLQPTESGGTPTITDVFLSDAGYIAPRGGSLPETYFDGRVSQPLSLSWVIPVTPEGERRIALEAAGIEVINSDGELDDLVDDKDIGGRNVTVLFGLKSSVYDQFTPIFTGAGVSWSRDFSRVHIVARDRGYLLDRPLQTAVYGGGGGSAGTLDNAGKRKPISLGAPANIKPVLINPSNLIYQFHSRAAYSVDEVRDKGAALTAGADYASYALLEAATVGSGEYATCLAEGMFKLGSNPAGTVTADVHGEAVGGFATSTAQCALRLLTDFAGVNTFDTDAASFTAFDAAPNDGLIGWYQDQDSTITVQQAMNELIGHCGGYWGLTALGVIYVGLLEVPDSGASVEDYRTGDFEDIETIDPPNGSMPPRWRQTVAYQKNWTVQPPAEIVTSVGPTLTALYGLPYLTTSAYDTDIQAAFQLAQDSAILPSLFVEAAAALAAANRLLGLLGGATQAYRMSMNEEGLRPYFQRGVTVSITTPRINGGAQKYLRLIGATINAAKRQVDLILWG